MNIASYVKSRASQFPHKPAIITSKRSVTFQQLHQEIERVARGLQFRGVVKGTRTVVLLKPGIEFVTVAFALFRLGAVMVLIDPGMGLGPMLQCLDEVAPDAMVASFPILWMKKVLRRLRGIRITISPRGLKRFKDDLPFPVTDVGGSDPAAILFTTGSTGLAKGVLYEHRMFQAQVDEIQRQYQIGSDEKDLPTFPLFALFDPALGMTAVIPDMDFRRPASVDPKKIIEPIQKYEITQMFGSPALLGRVGEYGVAMNIKLPSLRRVISAGAPASPKALLAFSSMLGHDVEIFTPYGATEALPVASIGSREILLETARATAMGGGTCVGTPVEGVDVRVIRISDDPFPQWHDDLVVPRGTAGELVVRGPMVTRSYVARTEANRLSKIADQDGVWHRMGDVGTIDEQGRVWFFGRKSQRVETGTGTLFTDPVEGIFNAHPWVKRTALVGVGTKGRQMPVVVVELSERVRLGTAERAKFFAELKLLAQSHAVTKEIDTFLVHRKFPVDIRHNAKIFREQLSEWAERQFS